MYCHCSNIIITVSLSFHTAGGKEATTSFFLLHPRPKASCLTSSGADHVHGAHVSSHRNVTSGVPSGAPSAAAPGLFPGCADDQWWPVSCLCRGPVFLCAQPDCGCHWFNSRRCGNWPHKRGQFQNLCHVTYAVYANAVGENISPKL